jgi:ornithine cyclodeaminase/alanine dehydrogenase-like protein (mu-crystallin family)
MTGRRRLLVLDRSQVAAALDWAPLLAVTREALIGLAAADAVEPLAAQMPLPGASLHVKGGAVRVPSLLSLKANLRPDAGSSDGAILVFDHAAGELRALLASGDLTARRTAAIAAVAAEALGAARDAVVAVLGAGPLGSAVEGVLDHVGIGRDVRVWSRSPERARAVAAARERGDGARACATVREAVDGADLVITCTPAREPLLVGEDLRSEALVLAMGADTPGKRELGEGVLDEAVLYADAPADAVTVGEYAYLPASQHSRVKSLGSFLGGNESSAGGGRLVMDSVGSPAVDAAVCAMVLDRAAASGSGSWLDF